jgi:hypothetical protein
LQQTTNYQLCQWDAADRILRTDFNSDNEKIDAAIQQQADAIAAEAATREALAGTVGTHLLHRVTTAESASAVEVVLPGVSWNAWRMVYLIITASPAGSTAMNIYTNGSTSSSNRMGGPQYFPASLLLFPLFNSQLRVSGICFGDSTPSPFLISGVTYSSLTKIRLAGFSDKIINAGTQLDFWGVK